MNNVYRTVTRCAGYVGILGSVLVSSAALAGPGIGTYTDSAKTVRFNSMAGGAYVQSPTTTHVYVRATGKWTSFQDGVSRYKDLTVPVAKKTLRTGAVAALGRGFMHPGLQVAILAAGFIVANNEIVVPGENPDSSDYDPYVDPSTGYAFSGQNGYYANALSACRSMRDDSQYIYMSNFLYGGSPGSPTDYRCYFRSISDDSSTGYVNALYRYAGSTVIDETPYSANVPASESDLETMDPHIPPELADDLWSSSDSIPEWEDEISILGQPASQVDSGTKNQPPEVADAVGKWAENLSAQYNGDQQPHQDGETGGQSAEDQQYDENQEPPPPFPDEEVNWQTEVLSLPSFSSGIGAGSCPGPADISLPMGQSFTIGYDPACDLATMVRSPLIGVCGIIALLIVLRARGGA